jgi:glycosyltransferase involved in cell wall biosynthesis
MEQRLEESGSIGQCRRRPSEDAMIRDRDIAISMIMPNHNGARYLAKSIGAFLEQSHDNKELLIVDGKSTDGSHAIIADWCAGNSCIRWLRHEDVGISDAVNFAIERARGDVIGYLGSDDMLLNGVLRKVAELSAYVDFDGIFFKSFTYFVRERRCSVQRPITAEITTANLLKYGTIVGGQNTFYRRRVFDRVRFNVQNRYSMDYELLLELAKLNAFFLYADDFCTINYFDGNISHDNPAQTAEATQVTLRFAEGFEGPLWCSSLLPRDVARRYEPANGLLTRLTRRLRRLRTEFAMRRSA